MATSAETEQKAGFLTNLLAQLRCIRSSLWKVAVWPVGCLTVGVAIWILCFSRVDAEREHIRRDAFRDAAALSKSYSQQLSRTIDQLDQIVLSLGYYWKQSGGTLRLEEQVDRDLYPKAGIFTLSIMSREGRVVTGYLPGAKDADLSDRAYFRVHREGTASGLFVEKLERGRITGRQVVIFSRALTDAQGRFDGVVYAGVQPQFLASFYDKSGSGRNDALAVLNREGEVIALKADRNMSGNGAFLTTPLKLAGPHGKAVFPGDRFTDGRSRILAWEMLDQYPFVSLVAFDERDVFAGLDVMKRDYFAISVVASILLGLIAVTGGILSWRLAWRKHQAAVVTDTYRLATEGAREGFFMARAVYGPNRRIEDFIIENCNEQGAFMLSRSTGQLAGLRFSQLYSGLMLSRVMAVYCEAMREGFLEDEFRMRRERHSVWMYRRLVRSGDGIAITLRDITEAKEHERTLQTMGNTDALTKLPNRHWLTQNLPRLLEKAARTQNRMAILYLDLDDFKNVNNTMGHSAGDEVLRQAGKRMQSVLRPGDQVVRLGGDEFTVILANVAGNEDAVPVANRLLDSLSRPFDVGDGLKHTTHSSIGISLYPDHGEGVEALLKHADIAMYAAKNAGKGRFAFYTPALTLELVSRINQEHALRQAVENDEFILHFQPRVLTATRELASMEALVRWQHPQRGLVPPLQFIPLAEETGLIVELGERVIDLACAQIAAWQKKGLRVVPISVNVSPRQFAECDMKATVATSLERHGVEPRLLEIEITESCMMQEGEKVGQDIAALKALGIRLSVDDFGTGYSSLSQLHRLDLDVLKVDRSFTAELVRGKHGEAFFMTIISMAHILDMEVVAEGVETLEQLTVLQALGCNEVQGYFISRPLPAEQAEALLHDAHAHRFLLPAGELA